MERQIVHAPVVDGDVSHERGERALPVVDGALDACLSDAGGRLDLVAEVLHVAMHEVFVELLLEECLSPDGFVSDPDVRVAHQVVRGVCVGDPVQLVGEDGALGEELGVSPLAFLGCAMRVGPEFVDQQTGEGRVELQGAEHRLDLGLQGFDPYVRGRANGGALGALAPVVASASVGLCGHRAAAFAAFQ